MGLSKSQWKERLKRLVPQWVFEKVKENDAIFSGMAAIMESAQSDVTEQIKETYIDQATDEYVELQGSERSVTRLTDENLSSYRERVKIIKNQSNLPDLKLLVDALLIRGESTFIQHDDQIGNFLNRENFLNRDIIDFQVVYNAFTILIDFQVPLPTSFYDRENFFNREDTFGSGDSLDSIFSNIIETVNKNKAYGTVYRLIERAAS